MIALKLPLKNTFVMGVFAGIFVDAVTHHIVWPAGTV
jgi:hypothetical protein